MTSQNINNDYIDSGYTVSGYYSSSSDSGLVDCDLTTIYSYLENINIVLAELQSRPIFNVDLLTQILQQINSNNINNFSVLNFSISSINTRLDNFEQKLLKLDTDINESDLPISDIVTNLQILTNKVELEFDSMNLYSLNGRGSEFKDGQLVSVENRLEVFKVVRSYFTVYADSAYTVYYDLQNDLGFTLSAPESLLTKKEL